MSVEIHPLCCFHELRFLGAKKHLYNGLNGLCPLVGLSVGWSVGNTSVRRSTRRTLLVYLFLSMWVCQHSAPSIELIHPDNVNKHRFWRQLLPDELSHCPQIGLQNRYDVAIFVSEQLSCKVNVCFRDGLLSTSITFLLFEKISWH